MVTLIACSAGKRSIPCAAEFMYTSPLFCAARMWQRRIGGDWFILSALHGLLDPGQVIVPYNVTLNTMTPRERKEWSYQVALKLQARLSPFEKVTVLAGKKYREFLVPIIRNEVLVPLAGLGIGKQLAFYKKEGLL